MTAAHAIPRGRPRAAGPRTAATALGRLAGPLLIALAVLMPVNEHAYRVRELTGAQWVVEHLLGLRTLLLDAPSAPVLYAGGSGGLEHGIALSTGCSSVLLIAPFVAVSGLLLLLGRRRPGRIVLGLALAAALIGAANLGRLTLIVAMQHRYGGEGFTWTHVLFGSVLMLIAALVALLCYLRLVTRATERRAAP
ncbi:archaeosortase/exosortase family protein [Kitasatospora sp. NPDC101183]|uniref:archaeosortase/exosortase family protein n=1 Tax=Kitasatospora sp. NPDC101183 TaxID=3364100 RepID=UPI00382C3D41